MKEADVFVNVVPLLGKNRSNVTSIDLVCSVSGR